jgi:tetratricopeptide (TPR) repeat protein
MLILHRLIGYARVFPAAFCALLFSLVPSGSAAQVVRPDSLTIARGAVLLAQAAGDSTALAKAVHDLGFAHWQRDAYDSALVHFIEARQLRKAIHDTVGLARVLNSIGSSHYHEGNYGPALEAYLQSLALRRAIGDQRGVAITLANIGKTYQDWHQYERAVLVFLDGVNAAEASGNAAALGYTLHSLGTGQIDIGQYAEARVSFGRSMEAYSRTGPHRTPIDSTSGWALNALALGKLDVIEGRPRQAIARFDSVLARATLAGTVRGEIESRLALGSARLANREPAKAVAEYERALALARPLELRAMQLDALDGMASAEEARGNASAALTHLRAHRALADSVFDRSSAHRVLAMELEIQAEKALRTNAALLLAQRLQDESLGRQRLVTALSSALLVLVAALAAMFWRFSRIARRQSRALEQSNAELGAANEELRTALADVRTLSGFIPICAHCKRVRDDDGYWKAVETYISSRSDASFSHAICHTCGPVLYGEDWESGDAGGGTTPAVR